MPLLAGLIRLLRNDGIASAGRTLWQRSKIRCNEWRLGIHTDAYIELNDLGIDLPEGRYYSATEYGTIRDFIALMKIDPREHVFLDFGAGMGRAMILAAQFPFRRVLGVEISPKLVQIALDNINASKSKLACKDLKIATADARDYEIPGDVTLAYFYNPFFGSTLRTVLRNLKHSLLRQPREAWIACSLPPDSLFEDEIRAHDWLLPLHRSDRENGRRYLIYKAL